MASLRAVENEEVLCRRVGGLFSLVGGHEVRAVAMARTALSAIEDDSPTLILSASLTAKTKQWIARLEGVTHLWKPIDPEMLQAVVAEALAVRQARRRTLVTPLPGVCFRKETA